MSRRALVPLALLVLTSVAASPAAGQSTTPPPTAASATTPLTKTGYVLIVDGDTLLLSDTPMGKVVPMPGGGMFVSEAPKTGAGADDKKAATPPATAENTWVAAPPGRAGQSGTVVAGAAPAGGRMGMMAMRPEGADEGEPTISSYVTSAATKGKDLLKAGERVTVQYREVNGQLLADVITTPLPEKGKGR